MTDDVRQVIRDGDTEECPHDETVTIGVGEEEGRTNFKTKRCDDCGRVWDAYENWSFGSGDLGWEEVEEWQQESEDWPQYYVAGEGVDDEEFVPCYFRVEGPNGPVYYMNPGSDQIHPTTMMAFAMEAQSDSFREVHSSEETPFPDSSEQDA